MTPPASTSDRSHRHRRVTRVGIVARADLHRAARVLVDLGEWLQKRGVEPIFEERTSSLAADAHAADARANAHAHATDARAAGAPGAAGAAASGTAVGVGVGVGGQKTVRLEELIGMVDLIVLLGGDGTLLGTADRIAMAGASIPILGVNFGSLGFLTEITLPELYDALETAINGDAPIEERLMLNAEIVEDGRVLEHVRVLNDVVVTRGALSRMTDLSVSVNDQFVARFKADGLIVATATGSTAYNLSAGGPIVHPGVDALVVTPIAPHTLTNRPVVVPASFTLVIQPLGGGSQPADVFVTFDGQVGHPLPVNRIVRITRADQPLRLVRPTTRSYFDVLRQKLKWAER
jgi:NAD+ kinase